MATWAANDANDYKEVFQVQDHFNQKYSKTHTHVFLLQIRAQLGELFVHNDEIGICKRTHARQFLSGHIQIVYVAENERSTVCHSRSVHRSDDTAEGLRRRRSFI